MPNEDRCKYLLIWGGVCFIFCNCLFPSVMAGTDRHCDGWSHPQGICGSRLSDVVSLVCGSGNVKKRNKRSLSSKYNLNELYTKRKAGDTMQEAPESDEKLIQLRQMHLERNAALSYLHQQKRSNYYEDGIVCECCFNMCSQCEIAEYCRTPPFACVNGRRVF